MPADPSDPTPAAEPVAVDAAASKAGRLLRVDQIWSRKDHQTHYVKTAKPKARPDRFGKTALVVRRIISRNGDVCRSEVDLKSPHIVTAMREFYEGIDGMSLHKTVPMARPEELFHARNFLQRCHDQEKAKPDADQQYVDDLAVALRYIGEDFGGMMLDLEALLARNEISFDALWALFPPKEVVYIHRYGMLTEHQAMHLIDATYGQRENGARYLELRGHIITTDGDLPGRAILAVQIDEFAGAWRIDALAAYPFSMHPEPEPLRKELVDRGRQFVALIRKPICKEYAGSTAIQMMTRPNGREQLVKIAVHGRVMVDPVAFNFYGEMQDLNQPWVYAKDHIEDLEAMTDDQLLLCAAWVNGFCLASKQWARFDVAKFVAVRWNEAAFDKLEIEEGRRRIVRGLVQAHRDDESAFDDFVQFKGRGMVGLLSGNPGVGKTLTAEVVAEVTHRPLYQASGGELGMNPDKVDERLGTILEITRRWSAVLLIDEADVFLSARGKSVAQDTLVSIFLRRIEYFQGVLILTTNRREEIDPAFQSRIHFRLHYPDLDETKRRSIWHTFLQPHRDVFKLSDADIAQLAKREFNGRQIKNATSCALSLASHNKKQLALPDVDEILNVIFD